VAFIEGKARSLEQQLGVVEGELVKKNIALF